MSMPLPLKVYLWLSRWAMGPARWHLHRRMRRGKEDVLRISERFGVASVPRPEGRLVWFHAASVGESLAILELVRRLIASPTGIRCLITTGTRTSAELLESRLPEGAVHQFVPVDAMRAVRAFLDHWRPDLAIWTESELWPTLICETSRRQIPMLMLNARMSRRSFRRWLRLKGSARALLMCFAKVYAQDSATAERFRRLGYAADGLEVTGSLKEGSVSLPYDQDELEHLRSDVEGRPLWCAASTHPGEEEAVILALKVAKKQFPALLTVLVPRHPARGDKVAALLARAGLKVRRRSQGGRPDRETDVYLADTLGEMGLWYRLAPVSFVGGSLAAVGGHNPFEPAGLGSAILHGPHVENFADIYQRLGKTGGARLVAEASELGTALIDTLQPGVAAKMAAAAKEACPDGSDITERALTLVESVLNARAAA